MCYVAQLETSRAASTAGAMRHAGTGRATCLQRGEPADFDVAVGEHARALSTATHRLDTRNEFEDQLIEN